MQKHLTNIAHTLRGGGFNSFSLRASLLTCALLGWGLPGAARGAQERQIPVDDLDLWHCEYFAGGGFRDGGRRETDGGLGAMAFDVYGNGFVAAGSTLWVILPDGTVRHVAGVPDVPGTADGPTDRACLKRIAAIAVHPAAGDIYVADDGIAIRRLRRDAAGGWRIETLAGNLDQAGHRDGVGREARLKRVDGIALDSKGHLYMADQDFLRRLAPDGMVTTLNPKGGTGGFGPGVECPLESLKMNRIMGAGALACDEHDNVLLADKWNGTFYRVDVAAGKVNVLAGAPARGQKGFRNGAPGRDGQGNSVAIFHAGGGPSGVWYDPLSRRIYTYTADEHAVRAIMPDGMVKTGGPWKARNSPLLVPGPVKETAGYVAPVGIDRQGNLYVGYRNGPIYRFRRKPALEGAPPLLTPNPLLPWPKRDMADTGEATFTLAGAPESGVNFGAGAPVTAEGWELPRLPDAVVIKMGAKTWRANPTLKSAMAERDGVSIAVRVEKMAPEGGKPPRSRVLADIKRSVAGDRDIKTLATEVAPEGGDPVVVFDGRQFVVAYSRANSVYARRVALDGSLIDRQPIKPGGTWALRPALAVHDGTVAVTAARCPQWDPWGWGGPGAISIGRIMPDGSTPERNSVNYAQLADGGFAGLVDRSRWQGLPGWPAGRRGGFKTTENGYWPRLHSAVCWDGTSWVVAWVRVKLANGDRDIFACRVDPAAMLPLGEPALVAGGEREPGTQTHPTLVGMGQGTSALIYLNVLPDGRVVTTARALAGAAPSPAKETAQ